MTAQEPDVLIYEGDQKWIFSTPLESYFDKSHPRPEFQMTKTSNWRGYVATWELVNDQLFLNKLEGFLKGGGAASMQTVFPFATGPVFAEWVSQTLILPEGKQLKYVHMGFESVYEREIHLTIKRGKLTNKNVITNREDKNKKSFDPMDPSTFPQPPAPPSL
jgi:hypothetical protein